MNFADEPMMPTDAAALFAAMSEGMGLRHSDLATFLGIPADPDAIRMVRRWCTGVRTIPVVVYKKVADLYAELDRDVERRTADVEAAQARGEAPQLTTYRKLPDLLAAEPDLGYGSLEYHRAVLLRVWEATAAPLRYADE